MFYYSVKSKNKVVHYQGCRHLKNIKEENLRSFESVNDIRSSDYRICSCCSPIAERLKNEQEELQKFCQKEGLSYFVSKGILHIRTYNSKWKILFSNKRNVLELHHENSFEKEHSNSVPGYHRQKCISDSIIGYMKYIVNHEHYRMYNPILPNIKTEPPKKGSKRWNKQQKAIKRKERKQKIYNVIKLIDSLSMNTCVSRA